MVRSPDPMGRRWERSRSRRSSEHQERSNALWRERFPQSPDAPSSVASKHSGPAAGVEGGPMFLTPFTAWETVLSPHSSFAPRA